MDFDIIPFEDIKGDWKKLGSGSFGNVYKGNYLGIDVAIKEVLPSTEYDVAKYFEREWRLMKEARHPNVVLYLGLSRAPAPKNTIYIISEFIPSGNLRTYIFNTRLPLPWRLRISFATDITRALAYLHARNCIHRDLKGENLLITSNGRLKITDFGFARIAARDEQERKRLTFCGTDSYMSPEIMNGMEFGLPTDIFSLGVIFCELIARKLADDHTFKRAPPHYEIDPAEVQVLASPGCPPDFIRLALECCNTNQDRRPTVLQILERLRVVELEVLDKEGKGEEETYHVGSVKLFTGVGTKGRGTAKRPGAGPRMPSFGGAVNPSAVQGKEGATAKEGSGSGDDTPEETSEDEELMEAIEGMEVEDQGPDRPTEKPKSKEEMNGAKKLKEANDSLPLHRARQEVHAIEPSSSTESTDSDHATVIDHGKAATESTLSQEPLLNERLGHPSGSLVYTDYSTSVIKRNGNAPPSLSSIMTVRPTNPTPNATSTPARTTEEPISQSGFKTLTTDSHLSIDSYHTAKDVSSSAFTTTTNAPSVAIATIGGSSVRSASEIIGGLHRFTLIKPDAKSVIGNDGGKRKSFDAKAITRSKSPPETRTSPGATALKPVAGSKTGSQGSWSPFDFFFGSGFGFGGGKDKTAKCDLCGKRLGWRPCLECDDCGLRAHIKCGETAPRDCGLRGSTSQGVGMQILGSPKGKNTKLVAKVR